MDLYLSESENVPAGSCFPGSRRGAALIRHSRALFSVAAGFRGRGPRRTVSTRFTGLQRVISQALRPWRPEKVRAPRTRDQLIWIVWNVPPLHHYHSVLIPI